MGFYEAANSWNIKQMITMLHVSKQLEVTIDLVPIIRNIFFLEIEHMRTGCIGFN